MYPLRKVAADWLLDAETVADFAASIPKYLVLPSIRLVQSKTMNGSILRLPELISYTGLSRSAIYDRMDENSPRYDEGFPKQIKLGGSAVGWKRSEIDQWIQHCQNSPKETTQRSRLQEKVRKTKQPRKVVTSRSVDSTYVPLSADLARKLQFTEQFIVSLQQNEYLKACLRLPTWTPAMAALLASGIKAPIGCIEIPSKGEGIEGEALVASDARFHLARSIFKEWQGDFIEYDENDEPCGARESPKEISIVDFFIWCDESKIDTDWLRLIKEVAGCPVPGSVRHTLTSLAMRVSQSLPGGQVGDGEAKASGSVAAAEGSLDQSR